ncbi:MAG TPA: sigma-70 family RNA polymerase sigma factor [Ktedonobacteraceae bacterium]
MQTQTHHTAQDLGTSDNVLVHQALKGNQEAFEALMSRYEQSLFVLIYRYLGEYHETHDVLQLVWLQLYLSLATLLPNVHIKPWLFTVARNRCLDILRRKRFLSFSELEVGNEEHEAVFLDAIPDTSPTPEEVAEHSDLQREIQHAIQELPHNYRSVVLLYYGKQLSFSEIGQVLNISGSTVKTRFNRAKPLLRAALTAQLRVSSVQV